MCWGLKLRGSQFSLYGSVGRSADSLDTDTVARLPACHIVAHRNNISRTVRARDRVLLDGERVLTSDHEQIAILPEVWALHNSPRKHVSERTCNDTALILTSTSSDLGGVTFPSASTRLPGPSLVGRRYSRV